MATVRLEMSTNTQKKFVLNVIIDKGGIIVGIYLVNWLNLKAENINLFWISNFWALKVQNVVRDINVGLKIIW